jgi:hypothetical protein
MQEGILSEKENNKKPEATQAKNPISAPQLRRSAIPALVQWISDVSLGCRRKDCPSS